jgi:hypothetical protein
MHLYRLIFEADELLATGAITLPLRPATVDFLKEILNGKLGYDQVVSFAEAAHEILKAKETYSVLRHSPDKKRANEILMGMLYDYFYSIQY